MFISVQKLKRCYGGLQMNPLSFVFVVVFFLPISSMARQRLCFDRDWLFMLADSSNMSQPDYNDSHWRKLSVPHDWAIEGDFLVSNPSGAGGGALPGGVGWYRKHFSIGGRDQLFLKDNERLLVEFDGVYMNSTVYVNGHIAGCRPYGYSSFEYDITPYINRTGENVIAVKVDNSDQPNSRWYSGCGIYRHVWMTKVHQTHVAHWGTFVTSSIDSIQHEATFSIAVEVEHAIPRMRVVNTLLDPNGREVGRSQGCLSQITVRNPKLWSLESPQLYRLVTEICQGKKVIDTYETLTGVRTFRFDPLSGFSLNGKPMKINGVCEHHDLGCLGAALNEDALHRKLVKLKDMGANAIRCAHNPPAPELLNMCDTMGLLVMDEAFDMWRKRKTENDYARFFDEWHERDLSDLVKRDRNHPSIIMWSIGNEVLEQWPSADADTLSLEQANLLLNAGHSITTSDDNGALGVHMFLACHLADIVRKLDPTRPITAGCNEPNPGNHLFKSGALDIIGYNYHHQAALDAPHNFPDKPFLFTESVSSLATRGYYVMPSDSVFIAPREWWEPYTDPSFMCSSYDNMHPSWGSRHEETLDVVKRHPFVCGQFVWTGFDYIGEPTPYSFPARSSYFGLLDLAGFPKDAYYLYQSEWTQNGVLHVFPHWNWLEGENVDVWCYYNDADSVELFVNGRSQGARHKSAVESGEGYHVMWPVTFETGELKVVAYQGGVAVRENVVRSAGAAAGIRLRVDYRGNHTTFVVAEVVDSEGTVCPLADNEIFFEVCDGAKIIGVDNGCQTSMERFKDSRRRAFFGRCLAVVEGQGRIKAAAVGLHGAELKLR